MSGFGVGGWVGEWVRGLMVWWVVCGGWGLVNEWADVWMVGFG